LFFPVVEGTDERNCFVNFFLKTFASAVWPFEHDWNCFSVFLVNSWFIINVGWLLLLVVSGFGLFGVWCVAHQVMIGENFFELFYKFLKENLY
jgi:hypothetical protein